MTYERNLINAVLRSTEAGPVTQVLLRKYAGFDSALFEKTLNKFSESGLLGQRHGLIEVSANQRVNLAFRAIMLGADLEATCRFLKWSEFEGVAAEALEVNGYRTLRNLRFKHKGKRYEIDVLGFREPLILCIDCKHWRKRLNQSGLVKAVEAQVERTKAFSDALPSFWKHSINIKTSTNVTKNM